MRPYNASRSRRARSGRILAKAKGAQAGPREARKVRPSNGLDVGRQIRVKSLRYVIFLPLRATLTALLSLALGLQRLLQRMHCRAPLSAEDRVENRGKIMGVALPCVLLGCFRGPLTQARTELRVVVKPADHGS